MRSAGMRIPQSGSWAATMRSGPSYPTYALGGPIGVAFHTPDQKASKATRAKYGSGDDPDAGGYHLNQVDWDKDNGTATVTALEACEDGWYAPSPAAICSCGGPTGKCGCS